MENNTRKMLVGLCGRSGAGKGYVAKLFAEEGIPSIDTDAVYRDMTSACKDCDISECMLELMRHFGKNVKNPDNSLNRPFLRKIVFGDGNEKNLARLNEITHRHILKKTLKTAERLYEDGHSIVLIDAPLLYESGFDKLCAAIICVTAPEERLIERIRARDNLDRTSAILRLKSQIAQEELASKADYIIENDEDKTQLILQIQEISKSLKALRRMNINEL